MMEPPVYAKNIPPQEWGPGVWKWIDAVVASLDYSHTETYNFIFTFFQTLGPYLPCQDCRDNYRSFRRDIAFPTPPDVSTKSSKAWPLPFSKESLLVYVQALKDHARHGETIDAPSEVGTPAYVASREFYNSLYTTGTQNLNGKILPVTSTAGMKMVYERAQLSYRPHCCGARR